MKGSVSIFLVPSPFLGEGCKKSNISPGLSDSLSPFLPGWTEADIFNHL